MAGCLGPESSSVDVNTTDMPDENRNATDAAPNHTEPWTTTHHRAPTITEGHGNPFINHVVNGYCDTNLDLTIPETANALQAEVRAGDNATGTGSMTLALEGPGTGFLYPDGTIVENTLRLYPESPGTSDAITVDDPPPGEWFVWVWPHGPVLEQTWDLTITIEGTGDGADNVHLSPSGSGTPC